MEQYEVGDVAYNGSKRRRSSRCNGHARGDRHSFLDCPRFSATAPDDSHRNVTYNQGVAPCSGPVLEHCYTKRTEGERVDHTLWCERILDIIHRHANAQPMLLR